VCACAPSHGCPCGWCVWGETDPDHANDRSGCTAVTLLVTPDKRLFCANAGDSRCVLSRAGAAIPLSFDHKPDNDGTACAPWHAPETGPATGTAGQRPDTRLCLAAVATAGGEGGTLAPRALTHAFAPVCVCSGAAAHRAGRRLCVGRARKRYVSCPFFFVGVAQLDRCAWPVSLAGNLALSRAIGDFAFKTNVSLPPQDQMVTGTSIVVQALVGWWCALRGSEPLCLCTRAGWGTGAVPVQTTVPLCVPPAP
jgi:hypothetical protein